MHSTCTREEKTIHWQQGCKTARQDLRWCNEPLLHSSKLSGFKSLIGSLLYPLFHRGKGKFKNSLWASVPGSLSMFSQSGSISEFRWACSSSPSFSFTYTLACTQPVYRSFNTHRLNRAPSLKLTQMTACPWSFQYWVTSKFIDECYQCIFLPWPIHSHFAPVLHNLEYNNMLWRQKKKKVHPQLSGCQQICVCLLPKYVARPHLKIPSDLLSLASSCRAHLSKS